MDEKGMAIKLDNPGPNNGELVLVVDFIDKIISLIEIIPFGAQGERVYVWEVQSYNKVAG